MKIYRLGVFLSLGILLFLPCLYAGKSCTEIQKPISTPSPLLTKNNVDGVKYSTSNRTDGTTVTASCHNPDYVIVSGSTSRTCNNGKWSGTEPKCANPPPPKPPIRVDAIIGGILGGIILFIVVPIVVVGLMKTYQAHKIRQEEEKARLIEERKIRLVKVWSNDRLKKMFIKAEDLHSLEIEAARSFDKKGPVRIVLEEDGTEVTTDNILNACASKVLMVLVADETWTDSQSQTGNGSYPRKRLTFDVCSGDRRSRKLFLVEGLTDLFEQASLFLASRPTRACLEEDGTIIEDDEVLFNSSSSVIMVLKVGEFWTSGRFAATNLPDLQMDNSGHVKRRMFKVWSEDRRAKLAIFADNLASLHINAAKAHRLDNPIEIYVMQSGESVKSDTHLDDCENDVLCVRKPKPSNQYYEALPDTDQYSQVDKRIGQRFPHYHENVYIDLPEPGSVQDDVSTVDYHRHVYKSNEHSKKPPTSHYSQVNKKWDEPVISVKNGHNPNDSSSKGFQNGRIPSDKSSNGFQNGRIPSDKSSNGFLNGRIPSDKSSNGFQNGRIPSDRSANGLQNGNIPSATGDKKWPQFGNAVPLANFNKSPVYMDSEPRHQEETDFSQAHNKLYGRNDNNSENNFEWLRNQQENQHSPNRKPFIVTGGEGNTNLKNSDVLF